MPYDLLIRRAIILQHILNEIDTPARTIQLIAKRNIGRASRCAEAAMHAFTQNFFSLIDTRIKQLLGRELGLHGSHSCLISINTPRIENILRIKLLLQTL